MGSFSLTTNKRIISHAFRMLIIFGKSQTDTQLPFAVNMMRELSIISKHRDRRESRLVIHAIKFIPLPGYI